MSFYNILGFYPLDIELYQQALLHKSSSVKLKSGRWVNNERLEFLGDAILDAIVADILFKEFESKKEGFLTNIRSRIVQRETLNRLALDLGIDKIVKTSARAATGNTHMYGNALEALIGAIYLDRGYRVAKSFVKEKLIDQYLDIDSVVSLQSNFKSELIEWGQKNKIAVTFDLISSSIDSSNVPTFVSMVLIDGIPAGEGEGHAKKESQQKAAEQAVTKLKEDKNFKQLIDERIKAIQAEE